MTEGPLYVAAAVNSAELASGRREAEYVAWFATAEAEQEGVLQVTVPMSVHTPVL